ncbi:MAG: hypothetical protein RLZZ435_3324 [Cyanobacteriota bacterium]|jgi:molecular chaperone DnaJ
MVEANHYQVLGLQSDATQAEIKQAYRKLAKQFHPDRYTGLDASANHDRIVAINVAYEVLGDLKRRQDYDSRRFSKASFSPGVERERGQRTPSPPRRRKHSVSEDDLIRDWLEQVYLPIDQVMEMVLRTYKAEINALAADPFDDELLDAFQGYLDRCGERQSQAENCFQSCANPAKLAQFAATLYYCLGHIGDGLKELGYFTTSYDENYLHTGQEMFRLAAQLRTEMERTYPQF